jgi:hypothetical protein
MAEAVHLTPVQFDVAAGQLLQVRAHYAGKISLLCIMTDILSHCDFFAIQANKKLPYCPLTVQLTIYTIRF